MYIRVVFLKLGEIDTLKENFAADAFIQARWREPALDGKTDLVRLNGLTVFVHLNFSNEHLLFFTLFVVNGQSVKNAP